MPLKVHLLRYTAEHVFFQLNVRDILITVFLVKDTKKSHFILLRFPFYNAI